MNGSVIAVKIVAVNSGNLPGADRGGELGKDVLCQCEAVPIFNGCAERLDQPAIEVQTVAAFVGATL